MKKAASKKLIALLIGAFVVGTGGAVLYKSRTNQPIENQTNQSQNQSSGEDSSGEKTDQLDGTSQSQDKNGPSSSSEQNSSGETTKTPATAPTNNTVSLDSLGTSVTAQKSLSDNTISVSFNLEDSGTFTVQEKVGGAWKTTTANIFYPGHGGLPVATLTAGQSSKTLRVLKNQNGKYVSVTKTFTVLRSDVEKAGIKTYN